MFFLQLKTNRNYCFNDLFSNAVVLLGVLIHNARRADNSCSIITHHWLCTILILFRWCVSYQRACVCVYVIILLHLAKETLVDLSCVGGETSIPLTLHGNSLVSLRVK